MGYEDFLAYYDRQGKTYFYDILKHLSDTTNLTEDDFIDWGHDKNYVKAIGVGECAGVVIDLIATLLFESEEKLENASEAYQAQQWSDSIYHSYSAIINTAKALLTSIGAKTNTHAGIIASFDEQFVATNKIILSTKFSELVYQIHKEKPSKAFAYRYLQNAKDFYTQIDVFRSKEVSHVN